MSYTRSHGIATAPPTANRRGAGWLLLQLLAAGLAAGPARAQGDCFPSRSSNEAKTFAIFAVPLAFTAAGAPTVGPGRWQLGLELTPLPGVSEEIATPTVCRPGKGPENTDLLAAAVRPRLAVGLGRGFTAEASWIPPLRVNQVRANLLGLALAWTAPIGSRSAVTLRGHGTIGRIRAPITCDDAALADAQSECFQGQRSDDSFRPNILGVEGMLSWTVAGGRLRPYVGAGYNHLGPRFQVNFTNAAGSTDNRRVEVDLDRGVLFGGVTWRVAPRLGLGGEMYAAPTDAVVGRLTLRFGLGD